MKKLLALLLAIICAFSLVACDGKEEATLAAEGFLQELSKLNVEGMTPYFESEEVANEFLKDISYETLMSNMPAEVAGFENEIKDFYSSIMTKISENISCEIIDVQKDKTGFLFKLNTKMPDFDNIDLESKLTEALDEKELENMIMDMLSKGEISISSSQEDIVKKVMPVMFEKFEEVINNIEFDTVEEETGLKMIKKDDKWIVDTQDTYLLK